MTGLYRLATSGSHVEDGADPSASTPDSTSAPQGATVPIEGSHSHQGGDLPTVKSTQLRQVCQKGEGKLLPHARHGTQEVVLLPPGGTLADCLAQIPVQIFQIPLQPCNVGFDARADSDRGGTQAVLL